MCWMEVGSDFLHYALRFVIIACCHAFISVTILFVSSGTSYLKSDIFDRCHLVRYWGNYPANRVREFVHFDLVQQIWQVSQHCDIICVLSSTTAETGFVLPVETLHRLEKWFFFPHFLQVLPYAGHLLGLRLLSICCFSLLTTSTEATEAPVMCLSLALPFDVGTILLLQLYERWLYILSSPDRLLHSAALLVLPQTIARLWGQTAPDFTWR